MSDALDVATAILERRHVDQMQLHKLVYFVQAGSLAWFGTPAFEEPIEAWTYGPVTRRVAGHYQEFGKDPIPAPSSGDPGALDERTKWVVDRIVDAYGSLSGPELARLTKEPGSPWQQTRGDLSSDEPSQEAIPRPLIAEFHRRHGVLPATPTPSETALTEQFLEGDADALAELFERATGVRPVVE